MSTPDATTPPRDSDAGFVTELRLAASFLTVLPVGVDNAGAESVAASFRWFPLLGFLLGGALAIEDRILSRFCPIMLCSALVILTLTLLTGAVHLDALADTADALGAGRDRARALDILRDSRIGSFGASAIFLSLALKIVALASIGGQHRYAALFLAAGLSRWALVGVATGLEYLRGEDGAGASLLQPKSNNFAIASVIAAAALILVFSRRAAASAVAAVLVTLAARWFYRRWLGGVTGDLIGACGEIVEVAVLIVFSAR